MRRFSFLVLFTAWALVAQDISAPGDKPGLKDYQLRALDNVLRHGKPAKDFDPVSLPMEKILATSTAKDRSCAIPSLEVKGDRHADPEVSKMTPTGFDKAPPLRLTQVCKAPN